jgi:lipoprotein-anchoring transpeptidase ErfK/SrfK
MRLPSLFCSLLATCLTVCWAKADTTILVSVPDQKLVLLHNGVPAAEFPVSTSRFGVGDRPRSFATPLGELEIACKIGDRALEGTVFHARRPTGEILRPNAPGRDPIVTRILWLRGLEAQNAHAYDRGIYIHGTPQEHLIGRPASFGCIRMRSKDVVKVFDAAPVGAKVEIVNAPVSRVIKETASEQRAVASAS